MTSDEYRRRKHNLMSDQILHDQKRLNSVTLSTFLIDTKKGSRLTATKQVPSRMLYPRMNLTLNKSNFPFTKASDSYLLSPTLDKASTLYVISHKSEQEDDLCRSPADVSEINSASFKRPLMTRRLHSFRQNPFQNNRTATKPIPTVFEDKNELNFDLT